MVLSDMLVILLTFKDNFGIPGQNSIQIGRGDCFFIALRRRLCTRSQVRSSGAQTSEEVNGYRIININTG